MHIGHIVVKQCFAPVGFCRAKSRPVTNEDRELLKLIALRVRHLRGQESQDSLSGRAGVSRRVVGDIERGTRDFQISSLLRILHALNADLPGILGVREIERGSHLQARLLCDQLRDLFELGEPIERLIVTAVTQCHKAMVKPRHGPQNPNKPSS